MQENLIERQEPRKIQFTPNINPYAYGSVMAEFGNTKVHITAFVEESVPPFLKGKNQGWVTGEYSMLPGSTHTRGRRERKGAGGRTYEIQRLIGRSLRAIVDLEALGERTISVDCDVLVADGGTRTTSISGAYVALKITCDRLMKEGLISKNPIKTQVGALSIGVNKSGKIIADLNYEEDSSCETDMNFVLTNDGRFVEVQGTAEGEPFNHDQFMALTNCAQEAIKVVFEAQNNAIKNA